MLFLLLPLCAGPVAEELLSQEVEFNGVTIAVCAPEGDETGEMIQRLTRGMRDVSRYAAFLSMEEEAALEALGEGAVSAVLLLPENFVGGVMDGTNPDVVLVVSGQQPLEALLTYWVGQSAADLLTGVQRGIYAVLELMPAQTPGGMTWDEALVAINIRYVNLTLNRQNFFRVRELSAAGSMELSVYYGLSLLLFLLMVLPPLFCPLFDGRNSAFYRRLSSLGCGAVFRLGSRISVCVMTALAMVLLPGMLLTRGNLAGIMLAAVFAGAWAGVICLLTRASSLCGGVSFALGSGVLFVSGGVLPGALLPEAVNLAAAVLPAVHLRQLMALPLRDWEEVPLSVAVSLLWVAALLVLAAVLCRRGEEARA